MKIVVLDGYTLNPGDLAWDDLEKLGECTVHDRTAPDQVLARARDAEIVLTNKTVLSGEIIDSLPKLQYIGVLATGYNVVDVEAAARRGIPVTNIPEYGTASVAQMVFAHLLNLTQHVAEHAESVREGKWAANADFCFWDFPLLELSGRTMGIVGIGRIGREVARLAQAFGMQLLAYDPAAGEDTLEGIKQVSMEDLFGQSDVISLHCPLTPENREFVNRPLLDRMKPTAFLINTARGPLVDEAALAEALNAGRIAGAGLDVLSIEPPDGKSPLMNARNCYITPHIAWATHAARQRLMKTAIDNIRAFLRGQPVNTVG